MAASIGQAYRLRNTRTILIASHVLAVEARHAAWVRTLAGDLVPAPDAFNGSTFDANGFPRGGYARMSQVLAGVKQLGFISWLRPAGCLRGRRADRARPRPVRGRATVPVR